MGGAPTPKWDLIGFDPQPNGLARTMLQELRTHMSAAMYGWDWPVLSFIYPGFDCGSSGFVLFFWERGGRGGGEGGRVREPKQGLLLGLKRATSGESVFGVGTLF